MRVMEALLCRHADGEPGMARQFRAPMCKVHASRQVVSAAGSVLKRPHTLRPLTGAMQTKFTEDVGPLNETRGKALGLAKIDGTDGTDVATAMRNVCCPTQACEIALLSSLRALSLCRP